MRFLAFHLMFLPKVVRVGALILFLLLFLVGYRKKVRWMKLTGGTALTILAALSVFTPFWIEQERRACRAAYVFEEFFGFAAPLGTKFQSENGRIFGDRRNAEIQFISDAGTIQKIISTGFLEISFGEYARIRSPAFSAQRFFSRNDGGYLAVNDETGEVLFEWHEID